MVVKIIGILIPSMLMSACVPISTTNKPSDVSTHQASSYILPYKPNSNSSVIYIVQPYQFRDVAFIGGALSDAGAGYVNSKIYIQSLPNLEKRYIGQIEATTVCVRVPPGKYNILVTSIGATPAILNQSVIVGSNQTYMYALNTDAPSWKTGTINIAKINIDQGKYYIQQRPPSACSQLNSFSSPSDQFRYIVRLSNAGLQPVNFSTGNMAQESLPSRDTTATTALAPGKSAVVFDQIALRNNISRYFLYLRLDDGSFAPHDTTYILNDFNSPSLSVYTTNVWKKVPIKSSCKNSDKTIRCEVSVM